MSNKKETVMDKLPRRMQELVDENVRQGEEITAIAEGRTGEAVIVTDQRVFTVNEGEILQAFDKEEITGVKLSRRVRVGRFELFLENPEKYIVEKSQDDCIFSPDLSRNVVNFPYIKFPAFQLVEKQINALIGK